YDAILHAGADILQVFVVHTRRTAGNRRDVLNNRLRLRCFIALQIFDVDHPQAIEVDINAAAFASIVEGDLGGFAHRARDLKRLIHRAAEGRAYQLEGAAAVIEAGLVDRDALITQRLVYLDDAIEGFAGFGVGDLDVTLEAAGHTG